MMHVCCSSIHKRIDERMRLRFRPRFLYLIGIVLLILIVALLINNLPTQPYIYDHRINQIFLAAKTRSLCSLRSAKRGLDQHVLSVSAYESNDRRHLVTSLTWSYIQIFVAEAKKFYPSWVVRVYYYNLRNKTKDDIEALESQHENLDFCHVEDLPVLGNTRDKLPGKMQRFLPAVDPMVSVFAVRDLDSEIFEREVHAVHEWLFNTSYAFHIMRDNKEHGIEMLGGMWGLASDRLSLFDRFRLAQALLPSDDPKAIHNLVNTYADRGDQLFLTHHVWPIARKNSIAHDSFTCRWSHYIYRAETRPFPTPRKHPDCFVGCAKPCCIRTSDNPFDASRYKQCPPACRPKEHPDWIFC